MSFGGTEMEYTNNKEILFIIEVHGHAPEFWPAMAFRKGGGKGKKQPEEPERYKEIKCPYCGKRFMLVNAKRRLDLLRFSSRRKAPCHEYRKCRLCHESVGIVYCREAMPA
jgi:DNA-directed RNA polymerase subunit RPC12/RpoP